MKHLKTDESAYYFAGGITLPRVSRILDWKFGAYHGNPSNLKYLAAFGTMVHESIDRDKPLAGTQDHVDDALAFMSFIKFKTIKSELVVASRKFGYAGRLDRIGKSGNPGILTLIDWKTGQLTPRNRIAMNLYAIAYHEMTGNKVDAMFGVQLTGKGFKHHRIENDWTKALAIVGEYNKATGGQT